MPTLTLSKRFASFAFVLGIAAPLLSGAMVAAEGSRQPGARLATGAYHTCAVRANGTVQCWGQNDHGQLGDGTSIDRTTPVQVLDLSNAIAVAAGFSHTCALTADGSVYCWGSNLYSQLGSPVLGSVNSRPILVAGLSGVARVATGSHHSCGVTSLGEVRCWGGNYSGQLGDGTTTNRSNPVVVLGTSGSALTGIVDVSGGGSFTCALGVGGPVYCWGDNASGQVGVPVSSGVTITAATEVATLSGAVMIATGALHACALLVTRDLRCWGLNFHGQLGNGTFIDSSTPVTVLSGALNATGLAAGNRQTCLYRSTAVVQCWGWNNAGQLGDGTMISRNTPAAAVPNVGSAAGLANGGTGLHTCVLMADDRVKCWGYNASGQLGDGTLTIRTSPVTPLSAGSSQARTVANGTTHTCAVRANGAADCWGENADGQLGDGTNVGRPTPNAALAVAGLGNIVQIGSGNRFACAVTTGGGLSCWGNNGSGQLGNGTNLSSLVPVTVAAGFNATALAVSEAHACALKANSRIGCWGANGNGQLGDGTTVNRNTPVTVNAIVDAVGLASGRYHSCALRVGGTVQCWGANSYGQLGDGTMLQRTTPVTVTGLANVASISAGEYHTCARLAGGTVQCWGSNVEGQLGDGTTTNRPAPVAVSGIATAAAVTAHGEFTCALLTDGTASCWGDNFHGQLGDGTTTDRLTPVAVSTLTGLLSLGGTSDNLVNMSNCALTAGGRPFCWGNNTGGKLGDGTMTNRSTPTAVLSF